MVTAISDLRLQNLSPVVSSCSKHDVSLRFLQSSSGNKSKTARAAAPITRLVYRNVAVAVAGQKARVARQLVDKWLYYWLLITWRLIASSATRSRFGAEIGRFRTLGGWAGYCSQEPASMWFHCCGRQSKQTINYIFLCFFFSSCSSFLLLLLILFHLLIVIRIIHLYLILSLPSTINKYSLCLAFFNSVSWTMQ